MIHYTLIHNAFKCFKYLLINRIDDPKKTMEEYNFTQKREWINLHRYEWDCMALAIYFGQIEIITILMEQGISKGSHISHIEAAIYSYRIPLAKEIIDITKEEPDMNKAILNKGLLASAKNNNIMGLFLLISKGTDIDPKDHFYLTI